MQLRKLLQDGGLRELERQATYAIEHGKTRHAIENWRVNPINAAEGIFRLVAFDLTTAYGLCPGRALLVLFGSIGVFALGYAFVLIWGSGGIYRVRPEKRLEREFGVVKLVGQAEVEPLLPWSFWAALGPALQFSVNVVWRAPCGVPTGRTRVVRLRSDRGCANALSGAKRDGASSRSQGRRWGTAAASTKLRIQAGSDTWLLLGRVRAAALPRERPAHRR